MSEELKQIKCPICGSIEIEVKRINNDDHGLCWETFYTCKNCKRCTSKDSWSKLTEKEELRKLLAEKDREIESLKVELDNLRHFCDSILDMAKRNNGVLYFRQDSGTWKIETGKDIDALTNATDNNVGSMEETKPSCLNCKYIIKDNFYYKFHCRRFPPTIMQRGSFDYPVVDEHTTPCGEYKEQDK